MCLCVIKVQANNKLFFFSVLGIAGIDQVLNVLLTTAMFVGGCVAFILDNTIPGQCELQFYLQ